MLTGKSEKEREK